MLFQLNQLCCATEFSENSDATQYTPHHTWLRKLPMVWLVLALSFVLIAKSYAGEHIIRLTAEETQDDGFGNKLLAYKMLNHTIDGVDITSRYSPAATIPGPTIVLTEGDTVYLTIENAISGAFTHTPGISKQVSIHVHGVHYDILSDGTLKVINKHDDEGAGNGPEATHTSYEYKWNVAHGTAGTWPYHDHNFESHNGSENKGLFGAIIVKPIGAPHYAKEYVLYLGDDAFWGMEIDGVTQKQSKHGVNPSLGAVKNSDVRFHLIAMGTDIHKFVLDGYQWLDPGTHNLIHQVLIGPLEKHVFTVKAKNSARYMDNNFSNRLMGMVGKFKVQ
ncbi:multicopper oxidase domain-containing protein [Nitrosomonas sp. Nm166]|uniref:multicopper oxidase domain-containing protein n=1 Tax=Nitrosomonas sp. Nm166 TaxID=1881054 RepID=UPI0008EDD6B1|nr:multicopper oxidase domain-containing protein [Nitrosomonas sp. Nm166]SFE07375.1 Multicopper oxidase [Nitrosomonas sp. Nm166]